MSALGDGDIEARGEAFCTLVASGADIGEHIAPFLASPSRVVRAHSALVLANRGDVRWAGRVARLARDERASVRSAAMGALGHMAVRAAPGPLPCEAAAAAAVRSCLDDEDIEVRRSALQAAVHLGMGLDEAERSRLAAAADAEINRLLAAANAGSGGGAGAAAAAAGGGGPARAGAEA